MIFSEAAVQFGGGPMGSVWVRALSNYFDSVALVDPDSDKAKAVVDTEAHYINIDVLNSELDTESDKYLKRYLQSASVWSMDATPRVHDQLIELAIKEDDVQGLLVETPVSRDLDKLEKMVETCEEQNMKTGVDYIEMVHPVYDAVVEKAVEDGFVPQRGFHWRGKDLRYQVQPGKLYEGGVPFVKDNLCHDVSEVYGLFRALGNSRSDVTNESHPELHVSSVAEFDMWSDEEYEGGYPFREFTNDIGAEVTVQHPTSGSEFTFKGSYGDDEERRFFYWVGRHDKVAYYGNTLQRQYTTPAAYKIVGKDNVQAVEAALKSGEVVTKDEEMEVLREHDARPISFKSTAYTERVSRIARRIFSSDSPATLRDALHIERVTDEVYEKLGEQQASEY